MPGRNKDGQAKAVQFAFDAETWSMCVGAPISLTRVFRQKDQGRFRRTNVIVADLICVYAAFVDMLNSMRFGIMEQKTIAAFQELEREVKYDDDLEPTEL